ncbi:MAG: hypothetical protein ACYCXA_01135 [Actinomycetes bacterium]
MVIRTRSMVRQAVVPVMAAAVLVWPAAALATTGTTPALVLSAPIPPPAAPGSGTTLTILVRAPAGAFFSDYVRIRLLAPPGSRWAGAPRYHYPDGTSSAALTTCVTGSGGSALTCQSGVYLYVPAGGTVTLQVPVQLATTARLGATLTGGTAEIFDPNAGMYARTGITVSTLVPVVDQQRGASSGTTGSAGGGIHPGGTGVISLQVHNPGARALSTPGPIQVTAPPGVQLTGPPVLVTGGHPAGQTLGGCTPDPTRARLTCTDARVGLPAGATVTIRLPVAVASSVRAPTTLAGGSASVLGSAAATWQVTVTSPTTRSTAPIRSGLGPLPTRAIGAIAAGALVALVAAIALVDRHRRRAPRG